MALEWLPDIIGEAYTPEMGKALAQAIGKNFVIRSDFNEVNNKYKEARDKLAEYDSVVAERDAAKADIVKLQEAQAGLRKTYAVDIALSGAGVVNARAVKALLDLDKVTVDESGALAGLDDQLEGLRKTDSWAFTTSPARTQLPLGGTGNNGAGTPEVSPDTMINRLIRGKKE